MNSRPLGLRFGALGAALVLAAAIAAADATAGNPGHGLATAAKKKCKKNRSAVTSKKKCKKSVPAPIPTTPPSNPATPAPSPASLSISPTSHNYGTVLGDSGDQTFTVTNLGGSASGTLATSIGGTDPAHFVVSSDTCNGSALGGGSSCMVLVHCSNPDANGVPRSGTLTVSGTPGGSPFATLACVETT